MNEAIVFRVIAFLCVSAYTVYAAGSVEQTGSFTIGESATPIVNLRVPFKTFPSAFEVTPSVYSWVRNGLKGSGEFRTQVTSVDPTGFDVTVSRYDLATAGWDWSPSLEWDAQVQDEAVSMTLAPSDASTMTTHVTFTIPYATVPELNAWVRGNPDYPDTFSTQITNLDTAGYDVTIRRTDAPTTGWSQSPVLYWSAEEITEPMTESVSTLGNYNAANTYSIGSPLWVYTPALTDDNAGNYDVIGREIYMSTVRQMLVENSQGAFPLTQSTSTKSTMTLTVRGDTVYVDQPVINFQGLKSLTIKARNIISNEGTLYLQAPDVCETTDGSQCYYLTKADEMEDGVNGKSGVNSPTVNIYVHNVIGNVNVITQASNGNVAQSGGNGYTGTDNTWETAGLGNSETCGQACGDLFGEKNYVGYPGPNGGNGGDAAKAGIPGAGGNAGAVTVYTESLSGYISMKQMPGTGGFPAEHGLGGRGGYGGTGGCGRVCHAWLMCILIICWPECNSDPDCGADRGPNGISGQPGLDGFQEYPVPVPGAVGNINKADLRQKASVKSYFEADLELLDVIRRHGESLFQRNDNQGASDVFNFLLSVTSETSAMHQEVALKMDMINEGFDYYGHTQSYAPDLDWSYLFTRTESMVATGKAFEDAYNSVMDEVQDVVLVANTIQSTASAAISLEDRELANSEVELESAKNLYVKSLRQLERGMKSEVLQINILVPLAIVQDQVQELISGIPTLIGGIAGFVEGLIHLNPTDAFNSATQVLNVLFGRPDCDAPTIKEAAVTLQERLDFGYDYKKIDPEDLDFTTMDVSAVPVIMLSDLAKNKELLTKELECLYDNPDSQIVQDLDRVVDDFYRDAALRISLIDRIMNIDVQLKEIAYNRALLAEAQTTVDTAANSAEGSVSMEVKRSFSDLMFSLYQEEENTIMRSLYELSKAYQFSCLWDFDALDKYTNYFSDEVMTSNLGQLEGIFELQLLQQDLEDQRAVFLNLIASSAGPSSHTFNAYWEYNQATYPDIIDQLHTEGQFTFKIDVDPNDVTTTGCQDCYNGRLVSMYIELDGATQPSTVPTTVYIKVAHMGDSYFLVPETGGAVATTLLEQTPENVDGGHVMSYDQSNPVTSTQDPTLDAKFLKAEYKFCENSNEFFGVKPCKSPYATYVVTVPRNDELVCSLDPNEAVSGTNCMDLDFTKFTTVRVYAKVKAWSDYPVQPDLVTMETYVKAVRANRAQQE
ncbi:uncharacterized protein LOC100176654 [Ciona intestinalis]